MRTFSAPLAVLALASATAAQIGPDAKDQIKRIAEKVAEEMAEIDRLLTNRDAGQNASDAAKRAAESIQKMLEQAETANKRVQQGIDELIAQMKQQSGGGQGQESQDQPQDGQQPGSRRDQNGPREENQTPEMVQQQQQQQGQQQGQQQQQGQPKPEGQNPQAAQNRTAQKPPTEDGKEVVERAGDVGSWGALPEYLGAIKQRGGVPEVSEKYRKLYDAYLKAQAKKPGK